MAEELTPPTDAPPAETAAPPPPAETAPPPNPALQKLADLGFANVSTVEEGLDRLAEAFRQQRETYGAQIKEALEAVRGSQAQDDPPPSSANTNWFNPPQADLDLAARFRNPDLTWKEGTPAEVRQQVEAREQYLDRFARKLVNDPEGTLAPLLEKKFGEYFEQRYGQLTAAQQEQQFFDRALTDNADWLFEKDPLTGTHSRKLSLEGARFNELMVEFEQIGLPKAKAFEVALRLRAAEKVASAGKQPTAEDAAQASADRKQELLNRAAPANNRAGALPPNAPPKNRNLSAGQRFAQQAKREGVSLG